MQWLREHFRKLSNALEPGQLPAYFAMRNNAALPCVCVCTAANFYLVPVSIIPGIVQKLIDTETTALSNYTCPLNSPHVHAYLNLDVLRWQRPDLAAVVKHKVTNLRFHIQTAGDAVDLDCVVSHSKRTLKRLRQTKGGDTQFCLTPQSKPLLVVDRIGRALFLKGPEPKTTEVLPVWQCVKTALQFFEYF